MDISTVVSLSSIPSRFPTLGPTLLSLLHQEHRPDKVLLWIPPAYRRFPEWNGELPVVPEGVTIMRSTSDLGPATKILPSIDMHKGLAIRLVFCDDDHIYPSDWLGAITQLMDERPLQCIAAAGYDIRPSLGLPDRHGRLPRVDIRKGDLQAGDPVSGWHIKRSGFADIFAGFCGVGIRPEFFDDSVFQIPSVLWAVDDPWLSGHLESRGVPIWVDSQIPWPSVRDEVHAINPLVNAIIEDFDRRHADQACIEFYRSHKGVWKPTARERARVRYMHLRRMAKGILGR